jgi:hypothetical protein
MSLVLRPAATAWRIGFAEETKNAARTLKTTHFTFIIIGTFKGTKNLIRHTGLANQVYTLHSANASLYSIFSSLTYSPLLVKQIRGVLWDVVLFVGFDSVCQRFSLVVPARTKDLAGPPKERRVAEQKTPAQRKRLAASGFGLTNNGTFY